MSRADIELLMRVLAGVVSVLAIFCGVFGVIALIMTQWYWAAVFLLLAGACLELRPFLR